MVIRNIFLPLLWKDKRIGINQYPPQPSPIGEVVKCVGCTPDPVLRTTFSHTEDKEEIDASHFHSLLKTRAAFTFAEVLITLGVIGVVAVLTLSIVIQNIQNKQNIAKWKKEYSVINNVFNEVAADGITICNYTKYGDCNGQSYTNEFISSFQSKLKIIDYCGIKTPDVPSEKICDYYNSSWYEKNAKYRWSGVANIYSRYKALGVRIESNPGSYSPYGISAYNFSRLALLLNDGAVIYLGESHGGPWIVVDVNNFQKGPNEFGRDVFVIHVTSNIKTGKHYLQPMGAEGTYDTASNGDVCECSPDKGAQNATYIGSAPGQTGEVIAGACCSAKYLME